MNSSWASFDPSRKYRYTLGRRWGHDWNPILWIMLNPSTADEMVLDQTLKRCMSFSKDWGYSAMLIANLYAKREVHPMFLFCDVDPVGRENDGAIIEQVRMAKAVILGWGSHASDEERGIERVSKVVSILRDAGVDPMCLGENKDGSPKHPLYLSSKTKPRLWSGMERFAK